MALRLRAGSSGLKGSRGDAEEQTRNLFLRLSASPREIQVVRHSVTGHELPGVYEFAFVRRPSAAHPDKLHPAYEYMRAVVQQCIDEKRFRRISADVASQSVWTAVHGITSLLISRPDFPWAGKEKVIATVVDNAINGLLAPAKKN